MIVADRETIADITARCLLEVKAVNFSDDKPSIFTSGWASPVYIDCRKLISFPRVRRTLMDLAQATILRDVGFEQVDAVAGGETAGIAFAAWIAERMMLPMLYVRKKPKGFGRNAQIEGDVVEGSRVLLVEDLSTDAQSKINFVKALREAGTIVKHVFVLFNYGIYPETRQILLDLDVQMHALATWRDVLRVAKQTSYFNSTAIGRVEAFLDHPAQWSAAHGGVSTIGAKQHG